MSLRGSADLGPNPSRAVGSLTHSHSSSSPPPPPPPASPPKITRDKRRPFRWLRLGESWNVRVSFSYSEGSGWAWVPCGRAEAGGGFENHVFPVENPGVSRSVMDGSMWKTVCLPGLEQACFFFQRIESGFFGGWAIALCLRLRSPAHGQTAAWSPCPHDGYRVWEGGMWRGCGRAARTGSASQPKRSQLGLSSCGLRDLMQLMQFKKKLVPLGGLFHQSVWSVSVTQVEQVALRACRAIWRRCIRTRGCCKGKMC